MRSPRRAASEGFSRQSQSSPISFSNSGLAAIRASSDLLLGRWPLAAAFLTPFRTVAGDLRPGAGRLSASWKRRSDAAPDATELSGGGPKGTLVTPAAGAPRPAAAPVDPGAPRRAGSVTRPLLSGGPGPQ